MRYFKYHYNDKAGRIWSLFSSLAEEQQNQSEFGLSCDYSHTLEIVKAAMSGSIALDDENLENFNLKAYEYKCKENDKIVRFNNAKKELFIVDGFSMDSDSKESPKVKYGDISEKSVMSLRTSSLDLDNIVNNASFNNNLENLLNIRTKVMVEYGVDVVIALSEALKGVSDAIDNIKQISDRDEYVKNVIIALCSSAEENRLAESLAASL